MIRITGLRIEAGDFAVEADLELAVGEYFVLLGPSGHGKSLLVETLAGLRQPVRGRIDIGGEDASQLPPERRGVGLVTHGGALFPHLTVRENVSFGLRLRRVARAEREATVARLASIAGLEQLLDRRPRSLSGGERQRVALARALAIGPRLLLLDEPLTGLDPSARHELQEALRRAHDAAGITTVHVTHDFEEALALADRVGVINRGRLVQVGTPDEVFRRPADETVARFLGIQNVLEGRVEGEPGGEALLCVDELRLRVVSETRGPARATVRPEEILLSREPLAASASNTLPGKVTALNERGPVVYVTVEIGGTPLVAMILRRSSQELAIEVGSPIHAVFKASAIHVF